MKHKVKSLWAGRYAHTKHGCTNSLPLAVWWFISWSIIEVINVLKLNKFHYGNIFCLGKKQTDNFGRIIN